MDLEQRLLDGLAAMPGLQIDIKHLGKQLLQYIELIVKWNSTHNLTAIRTPEAMITRHMLDSLTPLPYMVGSNIVDVGSGAGFPGIPIALARPEWQLTLVESNQKKVAFLMQVAIELNLQNVLVKSQRVENFIPEDNADTIISRAFSNLERFTQLTGHLCRNSVQHCRFMAMKGAFPDMELMQLSPNVSVERIIPVTVPGLKAKRHLIVMQYKA